MNSAFRDWSDLRAFLAVLREGSTAAAAKVLGMSQPTVARRIDVLEHGLGLTLFERSTKGLTPTVDGLALKPHAETMEAAAEALVATAMERRKAGTKTIRFTAPHVALTPNLTGIVADFRADNPGVAFEFLSTADVLDLAAGEADVALRYAREIGDKRLIARRLFDVRSAFFASEAYVARRGRPASAEETEGHTFVGNRRWWSGEAHLEELRRRIGWAGEFIRGDDQESVEATVSAGIAIGMLPLGRAAKMAGLVHLFDPPDPVTGHVWLVTSPAAHRRPEVRAFTAFFAPRYTAFLKAERAALLATQ